MQVSSMRMGDVVTRHTDELERRFVGELCLQHLITGERGLDCRHVITLVHHVERELVARGSRSRGHGDTSSRVLRMWARVSHRIWRTRWSDSPTSRAAVAALPPGVA